MELPTGTGKTVVGTADQPLSVAGNLRPVLYACPTQQLVHEVAAVAGQEGNPVVILLGSYSSWSQTDEAQVLFRPKRSGLPLTAPSSTSHRRSASQAP